VGLFSLPARVGPGWARVGAALCHLTSAVGFVLTGRLAGLGLLYAGAVVFSVLILVGQNLILALRDPKHLPPAFFTLNGLLSVVLGLATWVSLAY